MPMPAPNLLAARTARVGGGSTADLAAARETERQQQTGATIGRINSVYDSPVRQSGYNDFISALRAKFGTQINKQRGVAEQQNRFATARRGLTGGSEDVSGQRRLGEETQAASLTAEGKAQSALNALRDQDTQARLNLTGMATNGMDATTAATRGLFGIQSNLANARTNTLTEGLGDLFGGISQAARTKSYLDALRRGRETPPAFGEGY